MKAISSLGVRSPCSQSIVSCCTARHLYNDFTPTAPRRAAAHHGQLASPLPLYGGDVVAKMHFRLLLFTLHCCRYCRTTPHYRRSRRRGAARRGTARRGTAAINAPRATASGLSDTIAKSAHTCSLEAGHSTEICTRRQGR